MASIWKASPNKAHTVQFITAHGQRKSVTLERHLTKQQALTIKHWIERLNASQRAGLPYDHDCAQWLARIGDELHDRIASSGLIEARSTNRLGAVLTEYIESHRRGVASGTLCNWRQTEGALLDFFGTEKRINEITEDDAREWREWMLENGRGDNTARRYAGYAVQLLTPAMKKFRIIENPFAVLPLSVLPREDKYFLSREDTEKILAACEDPNDRLYFALARYGGLRLPSESKGLRWQHILWEQGKILLHAPKTNRHDGKGKRYIPLFSCLKPHLQEQFDAAADKEGLVISKYVDVHKIKKVVVSCGIEIWPDFYRTLRYSRRCELLSKRPANLVAGILGHSESTATRFYSGYDPADFDACTED